MERRGSNTFAWLVIAAAILVPTIVWFACERTPPIPGLMSSHRLPSSGMVPTLLPGDWFVVDRLAYLFAEPRSGDVVLFRAASTPEGVLPADERPEAPRIEFVQRIIGVPGDELELREARVNLNGVDLRLLPTETFIDTEPQRQKRVFREELAGVEHRIAFGEPYGLHLSLPTERIRVPDGRFFVMGDHRDASYDSRSFGTIRRDAIVGRATWVYFSWDPESSAVRWERIGEVLR